MSQRELERRIQRLEMQLNAITETMGQQGLTLDSLADTSENYKLVRADAIKDGYPVFLYNPSTGQIVPAEALDIVTQLGSGEYLGLLGLNDVSRFEPWIRVRENLIKNPAFQLWSATTDLLPNWTAIDTDNLRYYQESLIVRTDSFALRIVRSLADAGTTQPGVFQVYDHGADMSGLTVNGSSYTRRRNGPWQSIVSKVVVEALDVNDNVLATWNGGDVNTNSYTQSTTGNQTAPSGSRKAKIYQFVEEGKYRDVFVDDVSLIVDSVERIQNGGYETWSADALLPLAWEIPAGVTVSRSTDPASFIYAMEVNGLPSVGYCARYTATLNQDLFNQVFSGYMRVKRTSGSGSIKFRICALNSSGDVLGDDVVESAVVASSSYVPVSVTTPRIHPTATDLVFEIIPSDGTSVFRIDYASLVVGAQPLDQSYRGLDPELLLDLLMDAVQLAQATASQVADAVREVAEALADANSIDEATTSQNVAATNTQTIGNIKDAIDDGVAIV
jgi:hypothetical protein